MTGLSHTNGETDPFSIVAQFQAEFRGVAEHYRLAFNRHRLGQLKYVMERSLTRTLAHKYRIRVPQVYRPYRAVLDTEHGPRRGLQVIVHRHAEILGRQAAHNRADHCAKYPFLVS